MTKIRPEWLLEPQVLEDGRSRRSIVGDYMESLLDTKSRYVTDMDVPELVARMESGALSAVEVVTAFCKRAAYAHQLVSLAPSADGWNLSNSFLLVQYSARN